MSDRNSGKGDLGGKTMCGELEIIAVLYTDGRNGIRLRHGFSDGKRRARLYNIISKERRMILVN